MFFPLVIENSCPGLYNGVGTAVPEIVSCGVGSLFGLDYTIFAVFFLAIWAVFAYKFRLPAQINLATAFIIVYMVDIASGGANSILEIFLALLGVGVAISIVTGLMDYVGKYS